MARAALTDPLTPANVQPVGLTGFGDPIFSDEFTRSGWDNGKWLPWYPDTPFWNTTIPGGHKTNSNEPQGYDETGLSMIDGGGIRMTFHKSNHAVPELEYTSGMLSSFGKFDATYGVFEARMKLTNTSGAWPAFWMHPSNMIWPPEIDIMENWGRPSWNTSTVHTYHFPRPNSTPYSSTDYNLGVDVGNAFHTFSVIWEPGRIRWFVDGILAKDLKSELASTTPMYLILNLAGDKDNPAAGTSAPFSIDIDYVRAWSLTGAEVDPNLPDPDPEDPEEPVDPEPPAGALPAFYRNGKQMIPFLFTAQGRVPLTVNFLKATDSYPDTFYPDMLYPGKDT